jgi:TonB-linked SusC/RagA family outer membrane protein
MLKNSLLRNEPKNYAQKLLLIMKIATFFLFVVTFHLAAEGYSQDAKISLSFKSGTIREILAAIEAQTDYKIFYKTNQLDVNKQIVIAKSETTVSSILSETFRNTDLSFLLVDKVIVITPTKYIQTQKISGIVTDATNSEPIIGANVIIEGTAIGTITDTEGKFSLDIPNPDAVLVISILGYNTEHITVNGKNSFEIKLVPDITKLEEVVVVGYGTQKKVNVIGAVSSIKTDDISKMPVTGVANLIQGRTAGVQIVNSTGDPRNNGTVIIRGVGNIRGMGPLYVIDGVPAVGNTGFTMNLRDIADIQVLRDAASSAIYGAKAAGGVILITTKRGSFNDKMEVNFSANYGIRNATFLPKLLETSEYKKAWAAIRPDAINWNDSINTNWIDELYKTGKEQDYNISVKGGSEKSNYYVSLGYKRVDGVIIENWLERYSMRINSDYKLGKKIKVGQSLTLYSYSDEPPHISVTASNSYAIPFRSSPMMLVRDENRKAQGGWGGLPVVGNFNGNNWAHGAYTTQRKYNSYGAEGNVYIDIEVLKGLNIKAVGGGSWTGSMARQFEGKWNISGQINQPADNLNKQSSYGVTQVGQLFVQYSKAIAKHEFKIIGGTEARRSATDNVTARISAISSAYSAPVIADAFPVSFAENSDLSNIPAYPGRSGDMSYSMSRMLSYFGRIDYAFANKYLFEANIRQDISDRFSPDFRKGLFPSAAAGWRISEENFLKERVPLISNLKLRASYGSLGNDGVGAYAYIPSLGNYSKTQFNELGGTGPVNGWGINRIPNMTIRWETVISSNAGIDLGLFQNRFNLSLDYYIRTTKDMLYSRNVPLSSGMTRGHQAGNTYAIDMNLGKMRNKGVEINMEYTDKFGEVGFSVGLNAAFNRNKILDFGGESMPINNGSAGEYWGGSVCRTELGQPISQFYGFKTNGLIPDSTTLNQLNALANGNRAPGSRYWMAKGTGPGDIWYLDLNGDSIINDNDRTTIGNPLPKMTYGFNIKISYKGFEVAAFFNGVYGNDVYNGVNGYLSSIYNDFNTTSAVFNSSYMYGNGLTDQPRWGYMTGGAFQYDPNSNYKRISDFHVQKGSFLRLQNLQVAYNIPNQVLNLLKISSASIFYNGQNLFVISKVKNWDPEVGFSGANGGPMAQGIISAEVYPITRFHSIGIELGF